MNTGIGTIGKVALAAILLSCAAARAQAPATASAPATEGRKYALGPEWSAVERVDITRKSQIDTERQFLRAPGAGDSRQQVKISTILDFAFRVQRGEGGRTILEGPVSRVRTYADDRFGGDEKKTSLDTDKPEQNVKKYSYDEKLMVLAGQSFKLTLDEHQSPLGVEGTEAYARRLVMRLGYNDDPSVRGLKDMMDKTFPSVVLEAFSYLPSKPVAVGEAWKIRRDLRNFELIGHTMDPIAVENCREVIECKLKKIEAVAGHSIAVVEFDGQWLSCDDFPKMEGSADPAPSRLARTGELRIDVESKRILSYRALTDGTAIVYYTGIMSSLPRADKPIGTNRVKYTVSMDFSYPSATTQSQPKPATTSADPKP